jgi:hypothetical protein
VLCKMVRFRRINGVSKSRKSLRREVLGGAKRWMCDGDFEQSGLCAKRQTLVVKEVVTSVKVPLSALTNRSACLQERSYLTSIRLSQGGRGWSRLRTRPKRRVQAGSRV